MFILRKITSEGVRLNFYLGFSCTIVTELESPDQFKKSISHIESLDKDIYGIVGYENGQILMLYKNQDNRIMTSDGKEYLNISYYPHEL